MTVQKHMSPATPAAQPERGARSRIRVLIVDDHPLVREGLSVRISSQPDMEVCAMAATAARARKAIAEQHPDVVVVDLALKGESGLSLIKWLEKSEPAVRIVVFSAYDRRIYGGRSQRAGAHGYVNKQETSASILAAIRAVACGGIYPGTHPHAGDGRTTSGIDALTDRELEVFRLVGNGYGSGEIAERLHVSQNTVGTHKENIRRKLGARNATELLQQAVRWVLENR